MGGGQLLMADYKLVNTEQLDADMTSLADVIRAKGGTTETLAWPDGYKNAVANLAVGGDASSEDGLLAGTIVEYSNSRITTLRNYAFYGQRTLESVDLASAMQINGNCFNGCAKLSRVNLPVASYIGVNAFVACYALAILDFPKVQRIDVLAFSSCLALSTLILRRTAAVCTLVNTSAFSGTPIASGTGYIYVPRLMVDAFKAAENWSTYAAQIRAIEDYPEICG